MEAALVLPLVLLLLLGVMEYGWIFLRAQQITHAARHGARIAATADADYQKVDGAIGSWMAQVGFTGDQYDWWPEPENFTDLGTGELLTVTVTATAIELWPSTLVPTPDSFTAAVTMAKEGPGGGA